MSSSDETTGALAVRSPGAGLEVLDPWLRPVNGSGAIGHLDVVVPSGVYRVNARIAGTQESRVVVVRPGSSTDVDLHVDFDAAAPVAGTATENETHGMLAERLTRDSARGGRTTSIVVVLRGLRDQQTAPLEQPLIVFDARGRSIDIPAPVPDVDTSTNRALGWVLPLPQGGYRLRWTGPDAQPVEHAVWVSEGWQTLLFVPQGRHGPALSGMSAHLVSQETGWNRYSSETIAVETALAALRSSTVTAIDPRSWDALERAEDPMLALLSVHLIARAHRAGGLDPAPQGARDVTRQLAAAVRLLRTTLGRHPDVLALAVEFGSSRHSGGSARSAWPPMLAASLDLLLAARDGGGIPAGSVTAAVSGQRYASGPWLLWDPTGLQLEQRSAQRRATTRTQAFSDLAAPPPGRSPSTTVGRPSGPEPPDVAPSSMAVSRVQDLISAVASRLELEPDIAADRLGTPEIARRLGMAPSLVEVCLADIRGGNDRP